MKSSLAWLVLFCASVAADVSTTTVRLSSQTACSVETANSTASVPAASAGFPAELRELAGVSDARVCAVECAVWSPCTVATYRPGNRTCLLGNLGAWQPCSEVQPLTVMRRPAPPAALLSRLLGLYSFRFGLDNLVAAVAPSTALPSANATPAAKFIYGRGVKFSGAFNSYLEVSLAGLGGHPLSVTGRSTFYARIVPEFSTLGITMHTVFNNSFLPVNTFNHSGRWHLDALFGDAVFEAHDLSQLIYKVGSGFNVTSMAQSVAVVFDSANGARFYNNGAWKVTSPTSTAATVLARGEETLRIGYDPYYPFVGLLLCYAVAADNLTLIELQELDKIC